MNPTQLISLDGIKYYHEDGYFRDDIIENNLTQIFETRCTPQKCDELKRVFSALKAAFNKELVCYSLAPLDYLITSREITEYLTWFFINCDGDHCGYLFSHILTRCADLTFDLEPEHVAWLYFTATESNLCSLNAFKRICVLLKKSYYEKIPINEWDAVYSDLCIDAYDDCSHDPYPLETQMSI